MELGTRIANVRKSKGITQTFVAKRLKKTPQWLSNIEKGRRTIEAEELNKIAEILGENVGIFFKKELNVLFNNTGTDG